MSPRGRGRILFRRRRPRLALEGVQHAGQVRAGFLPVEHSRPVDGRLRVVCARTETNGDERAAQQGTAQHSTSLARAVLKRRVCLRDGEVLRATEIFKQSNLSRLGTRREHGLDGPCQRVDVFPGTHVLGPF